MQTVTATEYAVSYTSGHGIVGVLLSVYRIIPGQGIDYAVRDMPFADGAAAGAWALANGWTKEFVYQPK